MLQLTLLASSALVAASQSSSTCQWTSPQGSWDLSPLTLQSSTYVSTDARDSSFNYYYNFCSACRATCRRWGPWHGCVRVLTPRLSTGPYPPLSPPPPLPSSRVQEMP